MHQESLGQDCVPAKWLRASPSSPPRFSFSLWWCFQVRGLTPTWLLRPRLGRFLLLLLLLLLGAPLLLVALVALFPLLPPTLEGRLATSWFARALGARASVLRPTQGTGSQCYPGREPRAHRWTTAWHWPSVQSQTAHLLSCWPSHRRWPVDLRDCRHRNGPAIIFRGRPLFLPPPSQWRNDERVFGSGVMLPSRFVLT